VLDLAEAAGLGQVGLEVRRLARVGPRQVSDLAVVRSGDRGITWNEPVVVARMGTVDLVDRYSTFTIRPTPDNIPAAAVDRRTGRLYVAWTSGAFSDGRRSDIALSTSGDGGTTWSAPARINRTPGDAHAFIPTLAVLDDSTAGIHYTDLRNNTPDQLGILADHWLALCRAGCSDPAAWQEAHVAGPFDMQRAPYARGFFIGDYMGLAAQGDAFALLYVTTTPPDDPAPTAAFFVRVSPP